MPSLPPSSPALPQGKLSRMQTKEKNNHPFCFQQQQHQPGFFGMALFFSRLAFFTLNWYRTYINWAICLWTVILFSSLQLAGRMLRPPPPQSHSSWTLLNYIKLSFFFLQNGEVGSHRLHTDLPRSVPLKAEEQRNRRWNHTPLEIIAVFLLAPFMGTLCCGSAALLKRSNLTRVQKCARGSAVQSAMGGLEEAKSMFFSLFLWTSEIDRNRGAGIDWLEAIGFCNLLGKYRIELWDQVNSFSLLSAGIEFVLNCS